MEIIKNYLENMFMNLPKSGEVLKAKKELASMMEDKYSELIAEGKTDNEAVGIVISEFGNLEELANELGIENYLQSGISATLKRSIGLDEAREFLNASKTFAVRIAIGVFLCICSLIPQIVFSPIYENGNVSKAVSDAIGMVIMFVLVVVAVGLFIFNGMKYSKYDFLKKGNFQMDFATDAYIKEQGENYKGTFALYVTVGVILCILSVVPIVVSDAVLGSNKIVEAYTSGVLLFIVACGVFLIIISGVRMSAYKVLLKEDEYSEETKGKGKLVSMIASIYWPVVTCGYLAWSFITSDWGFTWIVWPISGVLFGAISSVCSIAEEKK